MSIVVAASTPSAVVGQENASELMRSVADYVQGAAHPDILDISRRSLNRGIDRINSRVWKDLTTTQTITLVADQRTYDLSANIKKPMHCERMNGSGNAEGRYYFKEYKSLLEEHINQATSDSPSVYSLDYSARKFVFNIPPSSGFASSWPTAKLTAYIRLPYLTQPDDVHGAPGEFNGYLIWEARAELAAVRGQDRSARFAEAKAGSLWRGLIANDSDQMTDWDV
jgi:hypothetical protein